MNQNEETASVQASVQAKVEDTENDENDGTNDSDWRDCQVMRIRMKQKKEEADLIWVSKNYDEDDEDDYDDYNPPYVEYD
jgi:hypothetical protein